MRNVCTCGHRKEQHTGLDSMLCLIDNCNCHGYTRMKIYRAQPAIHTEGTIKMRMAQLSRQLTNVAVQLEKLVSIIDNINFELAEIRREKD